MTSSAVHLSCKDIISKVCNRRHYIVFLVRSGGYRRMKLCLRRAKASAPAQKTVPRIKLVRIKRETVEVWPAKPTAVTGRFAA